MPGSGEQRPLVGELDDLAEVHDRDAVRDVLDHREVVRDEEVGEARAPLEGAEQVQHLGLHRYVEGRDRLVRDDDGRLERERAGDPEPLALPAGELVGVAVEVLEAKPGAREHLRDPVVLLAPRRDAVDLERLGDDSGGR